MGKKLWIAIGVLLLCVQFVGCSKREEQKTDEPYSKEIFAMDTYMTVTAYGENGKKAVELAEKEINRLDKLLSTGDSKSGVYEINHVGQGKLGTDGRYLLERSFELYNYTGGLFDVSVYPLMDAWGFTTQDFKVPQKEQINELLTLVNSSDIILNGNQVSFAKDNMAIDFGGIAKGYTSTRIMDIFRENEVESGMVSLGGNVQLYGLKPDGTRWKVGIQNPDDSSSYIGVLEASDVAVITSGGYERYFEENGKRYHHILDPRTGYPAENGLKSVTIVSPDGTLADGLSTSLFIMGETEAVDFWKQHSDEFDAILVRDDGSVIATAGIADSFECYFDIDIVKAD